MSDLIWLNSDKQWTKMELSVIQESHLSQVFLDTPYLFKLAMLFCESKFQVLRIRTVSILRLDIDVAVGPGARICIQSLAANKLDHHLVALRRHSQLHLCVLDDSKAISNPGFSIDSPFIDTVTHQQIHLKLLISKSALKNLTVSKLTAIFSDVLARSVIFNRHSLLYNPISAD